MRGSWSVRLLRACVALWFVLSGGELGLAHACPMHGGATAAAAATSHASHGAGAMHGHHEPASPGHAAHLCTCVGACSAPPAVATLDATPAVRAEVAMQAAVALRGDTGIRAPARAAHALPFANGPPGAALTA